MTKLHLAILAVGLPVGGWGQSPTMNLKSCPVVAERGCDANLVFTSTPTSNQPRMVLSQPPTIPYISSTEPVILKGEWHCNSQGSFTICIPMAKPTGILK